MKLEDFQTPIADEIWDRYSEDGDDFSFTMYLSHQAVEKKLALAVAVLKQSRMEHYSCEDDWYSCPNAKGHGKCDCGAEEHNKIINDALAQIEKP